MYYGDKDYNYLLMAMNGGCSVGCPQARKSLQKLGYMVPAKLRDKWNNGNIIPHGMVLTKKGQRRAMEIKAQLDQDRHDRIHQKDRRGARGAAFPKRWKLDRRCIKQPDYGSI